jgi:hypothetical protein
MQSVKRLEDRKIKKLRAGLFFCIGNFVYQYFQLEPDYAFALVISIYQATAMLFITFLPKK